MIYVWTSSNSSERRSSSQNIHTNIKSVIGSPFEAAWALPVTNAKSAEREARHTDAYFPTRLRPRVSPAMSSALRKIKKWSDGERSVETESARDASG
jgi:hypothetical protein